MGGALTLMGVVLVLLAILSLFFSRSSRRPAVYLGLAGIALAILGSQDVAADVMLIIAGVAVALAVLSAIRIRAGGIGATLALFAVCIGIAWAYQVAKPVDSGSAPPSDGGDECRDIAFIGLRGSGEARDAHLGYGGTVGEVRDDVHAAALKRGQTFADLPIDYPALPVVSDNGWSYFKDLISGDSLFVDGAEVGAEMAAAKIRLISSLCEGATQVVVVGYSQGAMAARLALDSLAPDERAIVVSVDLIADPLRRAGERDEWTGEAPPGAGVIIKQGLLEETPQLPNGARSWCLAGDGVCAARNKYADTAIDGLFRGVHTGGYAAAGVPEGIAALIAEATA